MKQYTIEKDFQKMSNSDKRHSTINPAGIPRILNCADVTSLIKITVY